jgi:putative intracellular protease/amidase
MPKILMILTSAQVWTMKNGAPHPTGFWAEEFVSPHRMFTAAGVEVSVATPGGLRPTVDPLSYLPAYNDSEAAISEQRGYLKKVDRVLLSTVKLEDADPASYDAVFVVGGHGPMQDLAVNTAIGDLLAVILEDPKKVVSAVCHGPAAFLPAHRKDGTWLFAGRTLTSFTNEEETQATFAGNAPWLLEDRLRLAGARFEVGPPWKSHVVVDGNLVTGQQNFSAKATASAVLAKFGRAA